MTERPPDPGYATDERTTLLGFLDYYRAVFARKIEGLDAGQLQVTVAPSDLTLGALLHHMALVEDDWFEYVLLGEPEREPWASADWDADADWEMTAAASTEPAVMWQRYHDAIGRSRATTDRMPLDALSVRLRRDQHVSLRWIVVHMIEEYARHCGHADFVRQAIDGRTGD